MFWCLNSFPLDRLCCGLTVCHTYLYICGSSVFPFLFVLWSNSFVYMFWCLAAFTVFPSIALRCGGLTVCLTCFDFLPLNSFSPRFVLWVNSLSYVFKYLLLNSCPFALCCGLTVCPSYLYICGSTVFPFLFALWSNSLFTCFDVLTVFPSIACVVG